MRTIKYENELKRIFNLCIHMNGALIVAEINDFYTQIEFKTDLKSQFKVINFTYQQLLDNEVRFYNLDLTLGNVIIFSGDIENIDDVVSVLNYNRDIFLHWKTNIIFILPSFAVNQLISVSANFWSCVVLHSDINQDFHSILRPDYIDTVNLGFTSDVGLESQSINSIIKSVFDKSVYIRSREDMKSFIHHGFQVTDEANIRMFFIKLIKMANVCYVNRKYAYSVLCCEFVLEKRYREFFFVLDDIYARDCLEIYSNSLFYLDDYGGALRALNFLGQQTDDYNLLNNCKKKAQIFNNLGVILYLLKDYNLAETAFLSSIELCPLDEAKYNECILAYVKKDYSTALDNLSDILQKMSNYRSKSYIYARGRLNTLKAYILVNHGDIVKSKEIIKETLSYLRDNLYENSIQIMEGHYIYSLVYYYAGELDNAKKCIEKALSISTKIKDFNTRPYLYELAGEIYFYYQEYEKAQSYLRYALKRNLKGDFFNYDLEQWIKEAIYICDKNY